MSSIGLVVELCPPDGGQTRRYRWSLTAPDEQAVSSTENFATKREAVQAGQVALQRAIERGSVNPNVGGRGRRPRRAAEDAAVPTLPLHR